MLKSTALFCWGVLPRLIVVSMSLCCFALGAQADEKDESTPASKVKPVSSVTTADKPLGTALTEEALPAAAAEHFQLDATRHVWAKFPAGAWREIKITSENGREVGDSINRSVTTKVEKLQSALGGRYTLQIQATVNLVGKQMVGPGMTRVLHTATDNTGEILETRRLDDQLIALQTGPMNCQVWEIVYREEPVTLVDRVYYSADKFPHVVRRETISSSGDGGGVPPEETSNVVAWEVPYKVGQEVQLCTCLQTVRQGEKGSTVRVSMISDAVPGGEVAVWTTEFDPAGHRTRWSSQELVAYGLTPRVEVPPTRRELRRARRNR